ncbi:hypothetical protein LX36DRAFT_740624 [Colletotrichum falcatum]|nr:hypothetical protein LX36DRAFT_740624 [Colletotrichum falcatum]
MLFLLVLLHSLPVSFCFPKAVVDRSHVRGYNVFNTAEDVVNDNLRHPFARDNGINITSWNKALRQRDSTTKPKCQCAWPKKHCLGCYRKLHGQRTDINDLTTENLVRAMLVSENELKDKCVFYTGVPDTSLFPGDTGNVGPSPKPDDLESYNYWEIDRPGSWLYPLSGSAYRFTYFENMSRAMARQCSGKVWVYSLTPKNLRWYGTQKGNNNEHSIWNKVEHKELVRQAKTTMLIGIDAVTKETFELDLATQAYKKDYMGPVPRELDFLVERADACSNRNLKYQSPGQDWFGTGYWSSNS